MDFNYKRENKKRTVSGIQCYRRTIESEWALKTKHILKIKDKFIRYIIRHLGKLL